MRNCDLAIIGGGPAGLAASIKAAELGVDDIVILERDDFLGGQLVKQTHKFFGSQEEYAGMRGIEIADLFKEKIAGEEAITVKKGAAAQGFYEDDVLGYTQNQKFKKLKPHKIILATGASEKMLTFPNNDLPGVYGAGAVQTLMNQYGIIPGQEVLMVGGGNIGLIVAYQLLQAGVNVKGVVEAESKIGGYYVHASKIKRCGVPVYTEHTISKALGSEEVEGAIIQELDENWQPKKGTRKELEVDTICLSVGLSPLVDLAIQAGCEMVYVPEFGGDVPWRDEEMRTSHENVFIAGDAAGVEEATAAILEGELAACAAARDLQADNNKLRAEKNEVTKKLKQLRQGPVGDEIRDGLEKIGRVADAGKDRYSHQERA